MITVNVRTGINLGPDVYDELMAKLFPHAGFCACACDPRHHRLTMGPTGLRMFCRNEMCSTHFLGSAFGGR